MSSSNKSKPAKERALITGASGGIGEGLARRFARAGHDLVLVARSADKLKTLASELKAQHKVDVVVLSADLAKPGEVTALAETLKQRKLAIDILVNNAGSNYTGEFEKLDPQMHRDLIALNVTTTTDMLAHFLPGMVERGHGRVLNVASTSSFVPVPFMATYAASKAYLLSLTESLSEELKGKGVSFTALCPGVTATPMLDSMSASNEKFVKFLAVTVLTVEEVAEAGYDACMKEQVIRIPGKVNLFQAISSRAMPKWMTRRVFGFMGRKAH
jgi:short-subunit dehydrogenase